MGKKINKINKLTKKQEVVKEDKIILSEEQIQSEIIEISKLEMPLDINKRIKKLAADSGENLSTLQAQLRYQKKKENSVINSGVGSVESVESVESVKSVESNNLLHLLQITLVSPTPDYLFSENLFSRVLKHFYETNNMSKSLVDLGLKLGEKKESIRAVINRHKEYFTDTSVQGRAGVIQVSDFGISEINDKISTFNENLKKKEEFEKRKKEQENDIKSFELNILKLIEEIKPKRDGNIITLDIKLLSENNPELSDEFFNNTHKFLEILLKHYGNNFSFNFINIPEINYVSIEGIRAKNLNEMITIEGRVVSLSEVKPMTKCITYGCPSCGNTIKIEQDYIEGTIKTPYKCICGRRGGFQIISEEKEDSCFLQLEDLQEKTDNPQSQRIKVVLFNNLCRGEKIKIFTPGNEIKCNGILKEVPTYKFGKRSTLSNKLIEIISAEPIEKDIDLENLSEDDLESIRNLSTKISEEGLSLISDSFAPEVHGYDYIKEAIILQLCNKRNDKKLSQVRNKSNILLIGDPGVAKSVLCDFAVSISSGSRKAVGGGSSAVGITASVIKEEESMGGYRVEPGALILAKDILFLDELNNLQDEDKPKLQEGMSEQTISINKANLHVQMKVSAGLLAVANPKYGNFKENDKETIEEQFNIPSPILNRFDSIFVVRDNINLERDKKIAEKMINRHNKKLIPIYDKAFLKKFFAYIKNVEEPKINEEIADYLKEIYSSIRSNNNPNLKINPRFLESLIRMATASAKIRLSDKVEKKDIETAMSIISQSQFKITYWETLKK